MNKEYDHYALLDKRDLEQAIKSKREQSKAAQASMDLERISKRIQLKESRAGEFSDVSTL